MAAEPAPLPSASKRCHASGRGADARTDTLGGSTELYFVYIKKTAAGGYDANVGRVPAR